MLRLSIKYQEEAIKTLIEKCLNKNEFKINFISPVGSGKTVMAYLYLEKYLNHFDNRNKKIAFVWFTPGKGDLLNQSIKSFKFSKEYSSENLKVEIKEVEDIILEGQLKENTLLCLNWEIVNKKNNRLRRIGEQNNLEECIENSNLDEIIILIDEAHESSSTEKSKEVIELFNSEKIIYVTATPKNKLNEEVIVSISDVIEEGFLKRSVYLNDKIDSKEVNELLLKSIEKQREIENEFKRIGKSFVPLCLIQSENAKGRNNPIDIIERLLKLGVAKEEIGVLLSSVPKELKDYEVDKEGVKKEDSLVRFLIFKQSIATGWDCPRAHILVKLRDSKSVTFDIQTLGRILRTIEKVHYENNVIDNAYLYTEYERSEMIIDSYINDQLKEKAKLKDSHKEVYKDKKLKASYIKSNKSIGVTTKDLFTELSLMVEKELTAKSIDLENLTENLNTGLIKLGSIEESVKGLSEEKNTMSIDRMKEIYIKDLKNNLYDFSEPLYFLIIKYLGSKNINADKHFVYKFYISNREYIKTRIYEILKKNTKKTIDKKDYSYEVSDIVEYNVIIPSSENYSYDKEPNLNVDYTGSKTEELFGNYLTFNESVKSWFKNGTGGEVSFSIVYKNDEGELSTYYPDFIIIDNKNKIYILDTKSNFGSSDFKNVINKYKAGKIYEKENRNFLINQGFSDVEFSMIKYIKDGKIPFICRKSENDVEDFNSINGWEEFKIK